MRPTDSMGLVFEGELEARVATQLLSDSGNAHLIEAIQPPVVRPQIGRLEYLGIIGQERKGQINTTEHSVEDHETALRVLESLASVSLDCALEELPPNRKRYMGQRIRDYRSKVFELIDEQTRVYEEKKAEPFRLGERVIVIGASEVEAGVLKKREAFVNRYAEEHGFDLNNLSIDQLLEIRDQEGWKNPQ